MGYLLLTVFTTVAVLVAYSNLISAAETKVSGDVGTRVKNGLWRMQQVPAVWLKQFPFRRRTEASGTLTPIEKRFDDYGHMR